MTREQVNDGPIPDTAPQGIDKVNRNALLCDTDSALLQQLLGLSYPVPAAAAAAGMNTLTYGPRPILGRDIFFFNQLSVTPIPGQAVQNADGSISMSRDGSNFGAVICTTQKVGSSWQGTAFRGGYYIDFKARFTPTLGSPVLPFPLAWMLDLPFLNGAPTQWPGMPTGFRRRIELDFFQWPHNSLSFWEGASLIDWYGTVLSGFDLIGFQLTGTAGQFSCTSRPMAVGDFITITGTYGGTGSITGYSTGTAYKVLSTNGSTTGTLGDVTGAAIVTTAGTPTGLRYSYGNITLPNPTTGAEIKIGPVTANPLLFSNWNRFGFLVTPATAATQGGILNYLNGVQVNYAAGAPNPVWNNYDGTLLAPPVAGTTAGSIIDILPMSLIFGTDSTCPMDIADIRVFQASAANNLVQ